MNCLVWAVRENDIERVEAILDQGNVSLNHESSGGTTALIAAAEKGFVEICEMLLDYGADIDHADSYAEETALICAARSGHSDVVSFLLEKGADYNVVSENGETSLTWAVSNNHVEVVALLISAGANINYQNRHGNTALMLAVASGKMKLVKMLTDAGADLDLCNKLKRTAGSLANSKRDRNMDHFLQKIAEERKRGQREGNDAGVAAESSKKSGGFEFTHVYKDDNGIVPQVISPMSSPTATASERSNNDVHNHISTERSKPKDNIERGIAVTEGDTNENEMVESAASASTDKSLHLPLLHVFIVTLMMLPITLIVSEYFYGYPRISDIFKSADEDWIVMDMDE